MQRSLQVDRDARDVVKKTSKIFLSIIVNQTLTILNNRLCITSVHYQFDKSSIIMRFACEHCIVSKQLTNIFLGNDILM